MNIDFSGQTILVTGATRGIGAAIAEAFGDAGARLILTGTQPDKVAELNARDAEAGVTHREYWAADFSDRDSLDAFLERLSGLDRLDVCVNNAGINRVNLIENVPAEDIDVVMDVNVRAPFLISKVASGLMRKNGYGRIVNVASIWGVKTKPGRSPYTTSKFGLIGLTKTLAAELGRDGILANAIAPGFVVTDMTNTLLSKEERAALAEQVPVGRFATPEEIANVVLFLSSDKNAYITGQNIVADGGFVSV